LRKETIDLLIVGTPLIAPLVYYISRLFNKPLVVNVHGLDLIYPNLFYQWMIKWVLPRSKRVIAISHAAADEAVKRGASPESVRIVPPGLDFSEFETIPKLEELRDRYDLNGRPILLSAGRLARRKGLIEFVKYSLPKIIDKHPDISFLIVGDNPTQSLTHKNDIKSEIQEVVDKLNLCNNVQMLGWVKRSELINLYYACDLFVLPAIPVAGDMEGFGIVFLEANAAGKPVVSTRLGGIPDAVENGKSGIIIEPEKWDVFTDTVLHILKNPQIGSAIGKYGRKRVIEEYNWSITIKKYRTCLIDIM
jgi:phosphatidylinositol alpha-1,6-mannosyltransferase